MYYYLLYEKTIATDIEFLQLLPTETVEEADVVVQCGNIPSFIRDEKERKYEIGEKVSWLSNPTCYLYVQDGKQITYELKEGGNPEHLKTYILGFGMAMLAVQMGELAMHCSAISNGREAVLICGEPGSGKSTLTSGFLNEGWSLMADDMAFVETDENHAMVKPAFPFQKLCRDVAVRQGFDLEKLIYINERKDKFLVPYQGSFKTHAMPVKCLIYLRTEECDAVESGEITGIDSFRLCAENMFLRHLLKAQKYRPVFGKAALAMASKIRTFYIIRPKDGDSLAQVTAKAKEYLDL